MLKLTAWSSRAKLRNSTHAEGNFVLVNRTLGRPRERQTAKEEQPPYRARTKAVQMDKARLGQNMKQDTFSPLGLIAIFAGIIEASALASLPFLSEASQGIYTWFLVAFPFFLTVLFFLTLNFNTRSLFSPATAAVPPAPRQTPPGKLFETPDTVQGSMIIALSGPESLKAVEQHIHDALQSPASAERQWIFYNLDARTCVRVSIAPLQQTPP